MATKLTRTGRSDSRTVLVNSLSPISLIPPHLIVELEALVESVLILLPPDLNESMWRLDAKDATFAELRGLADTEEAERIGVRCDRIRTVELETIQSIACFFLLLFLSGR